MALKELDSLLVFFCRCQRFKRTQISPFAGFGIFLPGVQPVA